MMERKLGLGLGALLCGLAWACVDPAQVDEDEPGNDGQEAASTSSTSDGSGQASAAEGSGGTRSESSTGSGPTGDASTGATDGTDGGGTSTTGPGGSTSGQQTTAGEGGPSGDDICPFDGELQYDPDGAYPFCEGTEGVYLGVGEPLPGDPEPLQNRCREQVPGSLVGLGRIAWQSVDGSPDAEPLTYCLCVDDCESDSDCPAGDTGNAEPACITGSTQTSCFLTCDNGETCPEGMICTQGHELEQRVCAWGTRDAGCDTSEWPNVTQPM